MIKITMIDINDITDENWKTIVKPTFETPSFQNLQKFLVRSHECGRVIFPSQHDIFNALNLTPFKNVKVIILGQDPYHGKGQAHGLSFSVPDGMRPPPSLKNIYKELARDVGFKIPQSGDLSRWAEQGVLLLNSTLTVEEGKAGSHQGQGWEEFTDFIITRLSKTKENLVFMLWGAYAQKKASFINQEKHLILKSVHPSPLSAHRGFIGCGHFSKANNYLIETKQKPIEWQG